MKPLVVLEQAVEQGTPNTMDAVESHLHSRAYVEKVFSLLIQPAVNTRRGEVVRVAFMLPPCGAPGSRTAKNEQRRQRPEGRLATGPRGAVTQRPGRESTSAYGKLLVLTFLVGSLVSVDDAHADTIEATGCSQEEVQNAIDAAREGDIVEVPAGTATWTTTASTKPAVLISEKTITLQGAGIDETVIIDGTGYAWKELLLWISGAKPSRITGFTFKGFIDKNRGAAAIAVRGDCRNWRIDHCKFDGSPRGVWAYAGCFGLVDSCTFLDTRQGVVMKGSGDKSWERPLKLAC